MKGESRIFIALCLLSFIGCSFIIPSNKLSTQIYFLDVGEGAATLIDSAELGRILVDTGNPGSNIVTKIHNLGYDSIDTLILTHPHPDHIGGAYGVVEFLKPRSIHDNGEILNENRPEERWYINNIRQSKKYQKLKAGDIFEGKYTRLEILSPTSLDPDWNTNSLIIKFTVHGKTTLLMADGNFATEKKLLKANMDIKADILQVGHHGAKDASSPEFLKVVAPKFAVISVNAENINGYPSKDVIQNVKKTGAKTFLTFEDGTISFSFTSSGIELIN